MSRGHQPTPAICRTVDHEKDGETRIPEYGEQPAKILGQPTDRVTHSRGWGDSGYRVQTVAHECPACSFDRMIRRVDVSPERRDEVRYWCLNPNCAHFVSDHLSHSCHGSYPQRDASEPAEFEEADA